MSKPGPSLLPTVRRWVSIAGLMVSTILPPASYADDLTVQLDSTEPALFETIRITIQTTRAEASTPARVQVDALLRDPESKEHVVPCFHIDGLTTDRTQWECRFASKQRGAWSGSVRIQIDELTLRSETFQWRVQPGSGHGFLAVDPGRRDALRFDSGLPFRGLGSNLGWEPRRRRELHPHSYEAMIPMLATNGANFIRTWICPWNMPLEWKLHGLGRYDPASAQRLDELLELARRHDIYVMLVLDYHGVLRTTPDVWGSNDEWKNNPYNHANGGPCATPADFFTHPEARQAYENRLRYLVARWGSHPNLAVWEFWNEIDIPIKSESIPKQTIVDWHDEMSAYLRSIDPTGRPVSTSLSHGDLPELWKGMDLVMTHFYQETGGLPKLVQEMSTRYEKPYIVGEFAFSWRSPNQIGQLDRYREELRLGSWRGLFSPTPILPMTWWWEHHQDRSEFAFLQPVRLILDRMLTPSGPLQPQKWSGPENLELLGLGGNEREFVWIRNNTDADSAAGSLQHGKTATDLSRVTAFSTETGLPTSVRLRPATDPHIPVPRLEPKQDRILELSPTPASISEWGSFFRIQLEEEILPYWLRHTVDRQHGGFLLADDLGQEGLQKQLVSQSRMIWGFAHAHLHGLDRPDGRYLKAAEQGYQFLVRHFFDPTHGGYFWSTDLQGQPINSRKIVYGQAFVIYALVEYGRASGDETAQERAMELFHTLQTRAHDKDHGGWTEHFRADWEPILKPESGTEVEIAGLKSANTHLHLMEAFAELYDQTQDTRVRTALEESLRLNQTWFYPTDPAESTFHRHPDGTRATGPASDGLSYGHNVEFAWLMIRAENILNLSPSWDHALAHLRHALAHGFDHELGGLYNKGFGNQPAADTEKVWWAQAEWVAALSDALKHQPDPAFEKALHQTLRFVQTRMIDPQDAVWIASTDRIGTPKWGSKAHDWKANYHDLRALIKLQPAKAGTTAF